MDCLSLTLFSFSLDRFMVLCSGKGNDDDDDNNSTCDDDDGESKGESGKGKSKGGSDKGGDDQGRQNGSNTRVALPLVQSDGDVNDDDNEVKVGHGKATMMMARAQGKSFL